MDERSDPAPAVQHPRQYPAATSKIEGEGEPPGHVVEAVGQPFRHFAEQEVVLLDPIRRPVPVEPNGATVEHGEGIGHGASMVEADAFANERPDGRPAAGVVPAPVRRAARLLLDSLLPPQCLGCGAIVGAMGVLCVACWKRTVFLGPPWCAACGLPFEFDVGEGALCGACSWRRPRFERARAALGYTDVGRRLILSFKHGDRTDAAPMLARWIVRAGADLLAEADLLVPVPLHWTRLFTRRYNQAGLLAHAISRLTGVPVALDLLVRRRRTPSQRKRNRDERWRNVRGAFAVRPHRGNRIEGRRVLLVDDVYTTGATLQASAGALQGSGAAAVDALTLARVTTSRPTSRLTNPGDDPL